MRSTKEDNGVNWAEADAWPGVSGGVPPFPLAADHSVVLPNCLDSFIEITYD